ncbi:hypothetical protein B0J11DRAFT_40 [Dendryphion nanum]|uniref:FAD-binding domain-containing protein n=1 Tax=Dendryphion nanum TaxID=256645 RepID=A0A9P9EJ05_9PLEO|nr:hypothetical protein B0J11DRAFT_40 [Dendryphion nanum]
MSDVKKLQIAIIGAGIAGLTTAIALQNHPGLDVHVFERATELREIGASIALGPNGMRTLDRLGIEAALTDDVAFRNTVTGWPHIYRHFKTSEILSKDAYEGQVERRHYTSRYYRAHLQQALLAHVEPSRIHLSKAFASLSSSPSGALIVHFTDSSTAPADLVLGADGIHSPVRRHFIPSSRPKWTGWVTFRSVFPISHVSHIKGLPEEASHYLSHDRTLFISRLGRDLYTVVGSYQSDPDAADAPWKDAVWNQEGDTKILKEYYKDWSPVVKDIIAAVPHTRIYPNASAEGIESWILGNGRVTLAGDAAHAHGGAFAAGGSLAIDDAWAFANAVEYIFPRKSEVVLEAGNIAKALRIYERTRKAHTDRVLKTVHKGNLAKIGRIGRAETDEELRKRAADREDMAWLHEHDVLAAFREAVRKEDGYGLVEARL